MFISGIGIVLLGVLPSQIVTYINRVTSIFIPQTTIDSRSWFAIQAPAEVGSSISPIALLIALFVVLFTTLFFVRRLFGKSKIVRKIAWACGIELVPDMSYSGISFSHPLQLIFKPIYGNSYFSSKRKEQVYFGLHFRKMFTHYIYDPLISVIVSISKRIRNIQDGSIHSYLAYVFITLIVVLLIVTMT